MGRRYSKDVLFDFDSADASDDDNKARDTAPLTEEASTYEEVTKGRNKRLSRALKQGVQRCKPGCKYTSLMKIISSL